MTSKKITIYLGEHMRNKSNQKVEILAPAGSYGSFHAAIAAGADAVYAGGPRFGARAFAKNFSVEEMLEAIDYAHLHGRKFYLTVNTLLKDKEIEELVEYLKPFYEGGLDAVIVQDWGVLKLIRETFPNMEIHASTQMTITSADGAAFVKEQGASRVVPARELSLQEIHEMKKRTGLEIECFVHGALCYCYSGQCLMSSMIGGRSGNRGQCAQPCRLPYQASGEHGHLLSMKDICTLDLIPDLIEAGIDSFKIEGRMKQPEYVAGVTSIYRKYVDMYLQNGREHYHVSKQDKEKLMDLYNRGGFHAGYYEQHNGRDMLAIKRPNHAGVTAVKIISQKGRELTVQTLTDIHKGDIVEFSGSKEIYTFGKDVKKGTNTMILAPKGQRFQAGSCLSRTRNQELIDFLNTNYTEHKVSEKINGFLRLAVGEPAVMTVWYHDTYIQIESEMVVQEASKRPLTKETVYEKITKTGNTEFEFESLEIEVDANAFLPVQQLNELRRKAIEELTQSVCVQYHRGMQDVPDIDEAKVKLVADCNALPNLTILAETKEQLSVLSDYKQVHRVYIESDMEGLFTDKFITSTVYRKLKENGTEIFLAMPRIFRLNAKQRFLNYKKNILNDFDGVLIRNLESLKFLEEIDFQKPKILDYNQYTMNRCTKDFWKNLGVSEFTVPAELNRQEMESLHVQDSELIIYGYTPIMTSAQCITKTIEGCKKRPQKLMLQDRLQNQFAVRNHCRECYNVIYNSSPLYLLDLKDEILDLGLVSLRLEFSIESSEEVRTILETYDAIYYKNVSDLDVPEQYTRGHFRRGIS